MIVLDRRLRALAVILLSTGIGGEAWAERAGPEFLVNTKKVGSQQSSSVAALEGGGFVVVWQSDSDGQDFSDLNVYGQRYGVDGAKVGKEFLVNTSNLFPQYSPSVASLEGGGFVAVWESEHEVSGSGVFGQRYDARGKRVGAQFPVNTTTERDQWDASVAGLDGGGFVVAWTSEHEKSRDNVYAQRFDAAGKKVGKEFRVNRAKGSHWGPSVAPLDGGDYIITWTSGGYRGSGSGVYGLRFDAAGAKVGKEFVVTTGGRNQRWGSSVVGLGGGAYFITWTSGRQDGSGEGVYGQLYDAAGAKVRGKFRINTTKKSNQWGPSATLLADGGFVVTWTSYRQDGYWWGVYGQRYSATGERIGREFQVNTTTKYDQWRPSVAPVGPGFVVTWSSDGQDGSSSETGVVGRLFKR